MFFSSFFNEIETKACIKDASLQMNVLNSYVQFKLCVIVMSQINPTFVSFRKSKRMTQSGSIAKNCLKVLTIIGVLLGIDTGDLA